MDVLTFISNLSSALSWPLVVLAIVYWMRPTLSELLILLKKFKFRDVEIDFGRVVEQAREEAREAQLPISLSVGDGGEAALLAQQFPEVVILNSFKNLEACIDELPNRVGLSKGESLSLNLIMFNIYKKGKISRAEYGAFNRLVEMRNIAVHKPGKLAITAGEVLEFKGVADGLAEKLRERFLKVQS